MRSVISRLTAALDQKQKASETKIAALEHRMKAVVNGSEETRQRLEKLEHRTSGQDELQKDL